ncbi:MAG TPA: aminotransferase class I/II-fold pyridoxal phosphate-dependent enzyme [Sphingobacteriaceae bacterium]|nr:aminotransferase class I/II-fold pyridoxal phosphate-dependent enzyme [Sphingobacteriaceae bacterium]
MMHNFQNDYSEGAHSAILERLVQTNLTQQAGYGQDEYAIAARELLRQRLNNSRAAIFFASGGTQANLLVISALLRPHEAVISAETGHIQVHETGAIEAVGHRIITVPPTDGKLWPEDLQKVLAAHTMRPHMVRPRLVYISNSTETGSFYSRAELQALYAACKDLDLLLFMDGARLGHALTAVGNDLRMEDLSYFTDVFYIGATKNGGLLGEAIVFNDPELCTDFDFIMKQKGAMLSKGRLLGIQFQVLFEHNLYFDLAQYANQQAARIAQAFAEAGFSFLHPPVTNQVFPILPIELINTLRKRFLFYDWKPMGDQGTATRWICSWATSDQAVEALQNALAPQATWGN